MSQRSSLRALPWLAVGGLLAGHALAGSLVAPHASGPDLHAYLTTVGRLGVVVATLGLTALVTGRLAADDRTVPSVGTLALRLAVLQATAFNAMEAAERVAAGAPLGDLVHVLPVGVAVQIVVAVALAVALRWLVRTTDRVREDLGVDACDRPHAPTSPIAEPAWLLAAATRPIGAARAPPPG